MSVKTNLVIVESPAKEKIITKYLNNIPELKKYGIFKVAASFGHIQNLDKKNGIEVDNNFKMNYVISPDKVKVVSNLKKKAKEADLVWLAADLDLEGEAIANSVKEVLKLKKYNRVVFNEITPMALKISFLNPRQIDEDLIAAQGARRTIDRLVGFKLTACLWKAFSSGNILSAGRTQSMGLKLIVDNEKLIDNFKTESYYKLNGTFSIDKIVISEASLYKDTTILKIDTKEKSVELLKLLINNEKHFKIKDISDKRINQKPDLPFITSTLQQEGSSKLHMSIKQVMATAQGLYEKGHITYMRTDSYNLSDHIHSQLEEYITNTYGSANYKKRVSSKKSKNSQEAHEAVRPTDITKETVDMSDQHKKLYEIIRKRTIASQMVDATYQEGSVKIGNKSLPTDVYFLGKAKVLINPGYLIVYNISPENINVDKWIRKIQDAKSITLNDLEANNTWTTPPTRFSEATFIKTLEKDGIGRPSTFASIIAKLYERNFINKKDIFGPKMDYIHYKYTKNSNKIIEIKENRELYNEKSKLEPTESGKAVSEFLHKNFSDIINIDFTSTVEEKLDEISEAKLTKLKFLTVFYKNFTNLLKEVQVNKDSKVDLKNSAYKKEFTINNNNYTVREARYGPVIETMVKEKKEYINLKAYLGIVKKNIEELNENDVKFVLQFPKKIGRKENEDVILLIGPYGFYIKHNEKNIKIPYNVKNTILTMKNYDSLLEYI